MERLHDENLVALCIQGDRKAFETLVKRYERQIFSLAYRLSNNHDDASDLTQEVFLHLFRVLHKFDAHKKFFPWMYRIATNVCYNALKKKPKNSYPLENVIDFTPLVASSSTQPENHFEVREVQEMVQNAIAELPENFRVPMILKYLEDLSYKQISDAMGLPVSTIETRLYRGRVMLQKRLSKVMEKGSKDEMSRR